ncbi:MAG TPA: dihydroorotase, partial [Puia sp.]
LIHEGIVSTRLGLPGKPMMSEELIIARDIKLVRYTQSRIHFTGVTSPKSIEYIQRGRDSGLDITCSVTPYHLFFSDEDLVEYDTNLKVYPPLRPKSVVEELKQALRDGRIDCIASHHMPHEYDSKILEFENAKYGMTGLETSYAVIQTLFPDLNAEKIYDLFGGNARKIFNMPKAGIEVNEKACLTLFNPLGTWTFNSQESRSKSRNSAFHLSTFTGKPVGTIRGEKIFLNNL